MINAGLKILKNICKKKPEPCLNNRFLQNSASSYYNKVRAALREAYKEGIIQRNPADETEGIKPGEPERQFLTLEELEAIAKEECEISILKRAFLFSALTGLALVGCSKNDLAEVQFSNEIGHYIRFRQKETKGAETQPISDQAFELLGERTIPDGTCICRFKI
ncbi:MAG: phage integrase SAM-like domain-containing protein [Bacteroidales bacterium]|nr:phage integrase SAM-like domain-containing protein [Bacteroidales bacterium]